jgi:hypothetical protein
MASFFIVTAYLPDSQAGGIRPRDPSLEIADKPGVPRGSAKFSDVTL